MSYLLLSGSDSGNMHKVVNLVISLRSQLAPNQELGFLELADGKSIFIYDSDNEHRAVDRIKILRSPLCQSSAADEDTKCILILG